MKKIIVVFLLLFLFGAGIFLLKPLFPFSFLRLLHIQSKNLNDDILVDRLNLIDSNYDQFKNQVNSYAKGKITFCDKYPKLVEMIKKQSNTSIGQLFTVRLDGFVAVSSLGESSVLAKFSYCRGYDNPNDYGYAVINFDSQDNFKVAKVFVDQYIGSYFNYGDWLKLEKQYGKLDFVSRSFMRKSQAKEYQVQIVKSYTNGWAEVYYNPFVIGLNDERPIGDNDLTFGLYKGKPVLFVTNEYIRFKKNLKQNQGLVVDFNNNYYFIDHKMITNQIFLNGIEDPNAYFNIIIRSNSEKDYHFSASFIQSAPEGYFVIDEEVTVDMFTQRDSDLKWIYVNKQPEVTNKIINDYKEYLLEINKLKGKV